MTTKQNDINHTEDCSSCRGYHLFEWGAAKGSGYQSANSQDEQNQEQALNVQTVLHRQRIRRREIKDNKKRHRRQITGGGVRLYSLLRRQQVKLVQPENHRRGS